jgi:hypothetical protein
MLAASNSEAHNMNVHAVQCRIIHMCRQRSETGTMTMGTYYDCVGFYP